MAYQPNSDSQHTINSVLFIRIYRKNPQEYYLKNGFDNDTRSTDSLNVF